MARHSLDIQYVERVRIKPVVQHGSLGGFVTRKIIVTPTAWDGGDSPPDTEIILFGRLPDDLKIEAVANPDIGDVLDDVLAYLKDQFDVVDGTDGQPASNRAMKLHQELTERLSGTPPC